MKERKDLNAESEEVRNNPQYYIDRKTFKVYEFEDVDEQYLFNLPDEED